MRKRKVMIMSLKDSMIRGLALSGMDAIPFMRLHDTYEGNPPQAAIGRHTTIIE